MVLDIREVLKRIPFTLRVCSTPGGIAEYISIQEAIDYADSQTGDWTIVLYPGTYDEGELESNGGADITIKGMGEGRVTIAPTAEPATAVIVTGNPLTLEDLIVTAPNANKPALAVEGSICNARNCTFNGVGAGDSIDMAAGTLNLDHCATNCDIMLHMNPCTLNAWNCDIFGAIGCAAEAVAHVINLVDCDMGASNIVSAATAGTTVTLLNCSDVGTVSVAGTGASVFRSSDVAVINNTNAGGSVTAYGGYIHSITRAVGPVVWWLDTNTLKVLPAGTITDTVIQWAVAAAGAGDTILIHPGTYEEAVTLAAGINLKGIDKELCVINIDHETLITMAAGCRVAGLTLNVTGDGTGNGIGVELNDAACSLEDIDISLVRTGSNAYAISELTGATARVIHIRNVRVVSDTNTNEHVLYCNQANKTFYIENCWGQGGDYGIHCTAASLFYIAHSHIEVNPGGMVGAIVCVAATMYLTECALLADIAVGDLGTVRLRGCYYRELSRTGTGNIVDESPSLRDAPWKVHRWDWMAALASMDIGVRGTPLDAGSGQILLEVADDTLSREAVESNPEAAGALGNEFTPARTPRFITQIAVDSFDAHVEMFFGLREVLGDYVPVATEDHAGFIWDGTNFKASSDDGVATRTTNLTTPTVNVPVQLEVIIFGGIISVGWVEFYIDGVLVATHTIGIPVQDLDHQHLLATAGAGGGDVIRVTVRSGGCQECPA